VRYGAFAIGYNVSTSVFGGTSALVIGTLINVFHTNYVPAFYLVVAGLIALVPILLIPETAGVSIKNVATPRRSNRLVTAAD
jgi:MHS family proline/betaine transporter-like MFS transporter